MNRRHFAMLAAAAMLAGANGWADAIARIPRDTLVAVDVYDRTDRTALPTYEKDGRRYIVGTPGHEYAVRVRNCLARRVLVVTSVDGVNVITGETAAPEQSGYVIEPYGSVEISGWRKSLAQTAAFYFTDLRDSYAARTGRPLDVGVIGVAVFPEKLQTALWRERRQWLAPGAAANEADAAVPSAPASAAPDPMPMRKESSQEAAAGGVARDEGARADAPLQPKLSAKLGTGHGRYESAPAQQVRFERESSQPAHTVVLQYERRDALIAMGVLPAPAIAYRAPNPFPALTFTPDPPR